ncbi:hypothetical protein lerEdw1_010020 [Lerista edwardsae]|nr:hypothetical protein lerEdw1_010020 [Lerista edwardsae]
MAQAAKQLKKIKDIEAQALAEQEKKEEDKRKRRNRSRDRKKKAASRKAVDSLLLRRVTEIPLRPARVLSAEKNPTVRYLIFKADMNVKFGYSDLNLKFRQTFHTKCRRNM